MGKSKFLDIIDNTKAIKKTMISRGYIRSQFISLCCLFLFFSCGLSEIKLLDDPLTAQEHLDLGLSYEKINEVDPAIKQYEMAAKSLPVAYLYLGNVYFKKNNFDEAVNNYKEAIRKDPQNSDAYNNLAWLYYTKKENLEEAEKLVLKAMTINPSKENIYLDTLDKIRILNRQNKKILTPSY
ncbi:tetratricopeptide repeat protein [Desulfobacterium sp. N47]|uniref:tetratricopeptide repeat protein n=1 Tax=Desulfobacterium sp. N47 TaxID=3115210 RepID=UPI003F4A6312